MTCNIVAHARRAVDMAGSGILNHLRQIAPLVAISVVRHDVIEVCFARLLAVGGLAAQPGNRLWELASVYDPTACVCLREAVAHGAT